MAEERRGASGFSGASGPLKHTVFFDGRERIAITGITDVLSFDEEAVYCETEKGVMILKGTNFHVTKLNLDNGELDIEGGVDQMTYEEHSAFAKGKPSFLGKIFR